MVDIKLKPVNEKSGSDYNIIKVIGVGGAGGNAVNNMHKKGIHGVDYYLINTDSQDFGKSPIPNENKIQIGKTLTEGLGAGNDPESGEEAAKESIEDIKSIFDERTKMVFITAGMGGGTGTGAAPIVAKVAKEKGILTVAVVTIPSSSEGIKRINNAIKGVEDLRKHVDSIIVIDNNKINKIYKELEVIKAWEKADDILAIAVKGIAEIITVRGHINVDFADVRSVLRDSGVALMSIGEGEGEYRIAYALREAINSPLLNNNKIEGAKSVLVNIATSENNMLHIGELDNILAAIQAITKKTDIIHGISINNDLEDKIRITIIATGFKDKELKLVETEPEVDRKILEIITGSDNFDKVLQGTNVRVTDDEPLVSEDGEFISEVGIDDIKKNKTVTGDSREEVGMKNEENTENVIYNDGTVSRNSYMDKNVD